MNKLFFQYISPEYEWAQSEGAGLCLRIGRRAWVIGSLDYRDKNPTWPRWLRFRLVLAGYRECKPRYWALYLFGWRVFNTLYSNHA